MAKKLEKRLEKAQAEAQAAKARWAALRQRREDGKARIEAARAELETVRREARAHELVPGRAAVAAGAPPEAAELEAEIGRLEAEEAEAKAAWDAAEVQRDTIARELVPERAEAVADAKRRTTDALASLGEAVLKPYADYLATLEAQNAAQADLDALLPQVRQEADRRLASRQRQELGRYLKDASADAPEEARLGYIVAQVLTWTRRATSPVESLWRAQGVEPMPGSLLYEPPIPAPEDLIFKLRDGRLPL